MRPLADYKAWLVDLDGTLYRARWVRLAMACELVLGHWRTIPLLRAFRQEHERIRGCDADPATNDLALKSPYVDQLERTAQRLNMSREDVELVVTHWMIERPGKWLWTFRRRSLLQEISQYKSAGGRTALVSDYPGQSKLQALRTSELFDVVIANGEPGGPARLKPAPDGCLLAAEKLGIAPPDCLVIGDRLDADGEAARRAGMAFRRIV
jgi:FMN phosphatase YigB (HAD superfamily)